MRKKPTAIIGIGNYLMSDEGVGVHAIEELGNLKWPDNIELIDGGTPGVSLLHIISGRKLAIIIDCADFGGKPGDIKVLDPENLLPDNKKESGLHATDLLTVLELAKQTANYPKKLVIIGIQPKKIEMGITLTPAILKSLKKLPPVINKMI